MNKECTEFLHLVRRGFPVYHKNEKRFFKDFSLAFKEYAERNPYCTQEELIKIFGNPKDIVAMYYSNADDVYSVILKTKHYFKRMLISGIIIADVILIVLVCLFMKTKNIHKK